jgi:hypothetical protein
MAATATTAVPHIARQIQCDLWNGAYKEYRRNPRVRNNIVAFQSGEWRFCLEEHDGKLYKMAYWNEHLVEKVVYQMPPTPPTSPILRALRM